MRTKSSFSLILDSKHGAPKNKLIVPRLVELFTLYT